VADKDEKNPTKPAASGSAQPGFNPKPVQLGGESIVDRLLPHMKQIVIGILVIAAVLSVIFTVRYFKERGRRKETGKIARVLDVSQREVRPPGAPAEPDAKQPTFASNKERAEAVLAALAKEGASPGGTYRGSLLVQAGRLDDAIAEYQKHTKGKSLDAVLAREGLGIATEMRAEQQKDAAARQKGLEDALAAFQAMQPDEKGPRYAYALYHQARILALLGKKAEAKTQFEKAKELGANTKLPELIEERLAGLGA
jgi:tetratricopeptide (TPR) repeat protein